MSDVYTLLTTPSTNKAFLNIFCNSVNANTMDIQTVNVNTLDSDSIESNVLLLNQSAVVGVPPVGYSALYADNTDRINVSSQSNPTQKIAYLSDIVGFNDNQIVSPDLLTKAECKDGDIFNVSLSSVDKLTLNNIKSKMSCGVSALQLAAVSDGLSEDTTTYMGASISPSQNTISIYTPDQFQVIQNNGSIQRLVIDNDSTNLFSKSILTGSSGSFLRLNDNSTFSIGTYVSGNGAIESSLGGNLGIYGGGAGTSTEYTLPPKITTSVFNGVARTSRHIIDQTTQTFYDSGINERLKIDSNVTLHNLYQMPNTAGSDGDTIIKNGIGSVWARPQVYGLFSATGAPVTVANTTVQTSLIPSGVGDGLTVPPNYFTAGMSFMLRCGGTFSDSAANTQITFRLTNSGVLFSTGLLTLSNVPNTQIGWNIDTQFTYTGGTQLITNFTFNYNDGSNARGFTNQQVNNTFNTTISNSLNFTVQWAIANPQNSITCNFFTLTKVF
jgi:hypothetical protein